MTAELLGFAGVVTAGLLAFIGALYAARPPKHLADIEGMRTLVDELQEERDALRGALAKCEAEVILLRRRHRW